MAPPRFEASAQHSAGLAGRYNTSPLLDILTENRGEPYQRQVSGES